MSDQSKWPLVMVEFYDLTSQDDWESFEEAAAIELAKCKIVGWLVLDDGKKTVVLSCISEDQSSMHMAIPNGCITSTKRLD